MARKLPVGIQRFEKSLLLSTIEAYFLGKRNCLKDWLWKRRKRNGRTIRYFIWT